MAEMECLISSIIYIRNNLCFSILFRLSPPRYVACRRAGECRLEIIAEKEKDEGGKRQEEMVLVPSIYQEHHRPEPRGAGRSALSARLRTSVRRRRRFLGSGSGRLLRRRLRDLIIFFKDE